MKSVFLCLIIATLIVISGCSDAVSPAKEPEIKIVGELATQHVNMFEIIKKQKKILENEVDSIKIVRIRIIMTEMKLYKDNIDSTDGKILKTGPFVYDLKENGKLVPISSANVPVGLYDKIKIEIHRFSTSETSQYQNDPVFMDFATSDRYSIIIEGISYYDNQPSIFTFNSQLTTNLILKFDPVLNLKDNSNTTISLKADPNFFFKKWESILDPTDPKNQNDIENSLINSIIGIKK